MAHRGPAVTSRGQRSNEPAAAAFAPPAGAPADPPRRVRRPGFALRRLVLVETALAVGVAGCVHGGAAAAGSVVVAGLLAPFAVAPFTVTRRRGRAVPGRLPTALALRARRRDAAAVAPGTHPDWAPVAEAAPGLAPYGYADRGRRTVGMAGDGSFLTAVVRVEAGRESLRRAPGARAFPLSLLGDALTVDDIVLESAQLVQQVRPAPARQSAARSSGVPPQERDGAPALRMTWVAVRLDPEACREAVEARGGGLGGAQRCLVRVADQVASRITGAGFRASVLDQEELRAVLAAALCARAAVPPGGGHRDGASGRRTAETPGAWRCDGRLHRSYVVDRWPGSGRGPAPLPRLVASLTRVPAYATTFCLTLRRGPYRAEVSVSGHVRVTGGSAAELAGACEALEREARSARVGLVRLDREQLPGVLATVPLGGTR
ncbi:type VII secretion protein EccE [Streptomyces sp. NPDC058195]|uniref:type VII secretion protein EccE n=1 Tax=Streptomyces sp. NPDC058195 TaxID=3346375 RepID=UPI0036EB8D46